MKARRGVLATALVTLAIWGYGEADPSTPGRFGELTSAVVLVNPVINQGSTTSVATSEDRAGIDVEAADLPVVETDDTGLALIEDLPTGSVPFRIADAEVSVQVAQERELYDVVLSWRGGQLVHVFPPVRYPIGGEVKVLEPGADIAASATDDAILLLEPGTYPGGIELRAERVLVFGAWSPEEGPLSIIEGDVAVLGGSGRFRGVEITGTLTSSAYGFSAAFSRLGGANITGNDVSLLRNDFTGGQATVPSSNAVLVDNVGIP